VGALLLRDLAQVATPAPDTGRVVRGADLRAVEVIEDAYILCRGEAIADVGRMRDLQPLDGDVEELDCSGLSAVPGLVDCHTHPAFGGDRVGEFSLRAGGAGYEELHAAGGGILSTVAATRALSPEALLERVERHAAWMLAHGTTTWEGKSGYGLDHDTELASLRAVRGAGGSPTWLGAHSVPPEHADADAYLDFVLAEVLTEAAQLADAADVFLERGAFDAPQARRYLEATGPIGVQELGYSDVVAVLLPASALFLDRPMPPGRALVDAGAAVALATDFNPGSSFTTSLPLIASLACTQLHLTPEEALVAMTVNAAHVLGVPDRGRLAAGLRADVTLLDAPDWRYLAYHLAGDLVSAVVRAGSTVYRR